MPRRLSLSRALAALLSCALPASAGAATATVVGRIFNPATQEYVRHAEIQVQGTDLVAYSESDGSYRLSDVPPGEITLIVTYTGYDRATAALTVAAGHTATRDFDLKGSVYQPGAARTVDAAKPGTAPVVLGEFVVSDEREGNAKALMEQRASLNMKSIVAADNFGDVTGGNVGEFIKYLPGIVMDGGAEPSTARINGLDASNVGVSIDGMNVASAGAANFDGGSRNFLFEQASIYGVESIEISKTTTASMDADTPGGRINLRSRNAFWRGFSVFGSVARTAADEEILDHVPKTSNGGIRFSNQKFNAQIRCVWTSSRLDFRDAPPERRSLALRTHRLRFQRSLTPSRRYEITLTGRNILNSPISRYSNVTHHLSSRLLFGPAWTLGVRGRF